MSDPFAPDPAPESARPIPGEPESEPLPDAPGAPSTQRDATTAESAADGPGAAPGSAPSEPRPPSTRSARVRAILGGRLVRSVSIAVIVVALLVAGMGIERLVLVPSGPATVAPPSAEVKLALIDQAWALLHQKYVDAASLDSTAMAYAAIKAMTDAVGDTGHTTFLTPDELAQSQAILGGSYVGVGAEMDMSGDEPIVVGVFRGSPAAVAGLRAGDIVVAIDGKPTKGLALDLIVTQVRGPAGTPVTLTVRRSAGGLQPQAGGLASPVPVPSASASPGTLLTLRIVRADVTIPAVGWGPVPGTSFVDVRVEQFSSGAGKAFTDALQAALATHPTGLILDLRGDPGGYVNEAVAVASQFVSTATIYISRDATGKEVPTTGLPDGMVPASLPVVVLVDQGTASSAEIVTGALQDAGRATIVGTRTFGTGTVLGRFDLADGSSLRIGTVEWLTPKGHRIWHEGIAPDVTVTLPTSVAPITPDQLPALGAAGLQRSSDAQLLKAIDLLRAKTGG